MFNASSLTLALIKQLSNSLNLIIKKYEIVIELILAFKISLQTKFSEFICKIWEQVLYYNKNFQVQKKIRSEWKVGGHNKNSN